LRKLSHNFQTNNILVPEQYGFWKGVSTENATFELTGSVFKSINQKLQVGALFYDLTKAFDCVNHKILLNEIHFFGIERIAASWFRSYKRDIQKY
jgi:hypothetical protein